MVTEPAPRPLRTRISVWLWIISHPRLILRRAIAAIYAAEDAKASSILLQNQVQALIDRQYQSIESIDHLQQEAASRDIATEDFRGHVNTLSATVDALTATITTLSRRLSVEADALSGERRMLQAEVQTTKGEIQSVNQKVVSLRSEIMFQQRRLTNLATPKSASPPDDAAIETVNGRLDSLYVALEDAFRGNRQDIRDRFWPYIDRLEIAGAGQRDKPILDIGCGRGEWLELLRDSGLHAYGIDANKTMVELSSSLGLEARHADAIGHLRSKEDASCSAVTVFHLVEHIPFSALVDLLDETLRVLAPGGMLIIETPNPETIRVGATTFYYDPTHRNPIMPDTLRCIVDHRGFAETEIIRLRPFTQGLMQEKTLDAEILNRVLFGSQDYAIVARRP